MKKIEINEEQLQLADKLTHLQRGFVINLVKGMSQRQAYKAAGGNCKNEKTMDANASRMLTEAKVKAFYDSLMESAAKGAVLSRNEALEYLSTIVRTTVKDVANFRSVTVGLDEDGTEVAQSFWELKGDDEIEDRAAQMITELSVGRHGIKFKMHNQLQALKQLSDMLGWDAPKKVAETDSQGNDIRATYENMSEAERIKRIEELTKKLEQPSAK